MITADPAMAGFTPAKVTSRRKPLWSVFFWGTITLTYLFSAWLNDRYQSVKQAERDALDTYLKENHCKIHKIISYTHVKDKIEYLCGNGVTVVREVGDMSDLLETGQSGKRLSPSGQSDTAE